MATGTRLLNITLEVTDKEIDNLLRHFGTRSGVTIEGLPAQEGRDIMYPDAQPGELDAPATPDVVVDGVAGELDRHGVPWNAEFHASTKTQTKSGEWKAKPKVDRAALKAYVDLHTTAPNISVNPEARAEPVAEPVAAPGLPPVAAPGLPPATAPGVPPVAAPGVPPIAAPEIIAPISFDDIAARFVEVTNTIGSEALMAQLGAIYTSAGVDPQGEVLKTDETARRAVYDAISKLAGLVN